MEEKDFKCRICGCTEYEVKTQGPLMMGGRNPIDYCYCKGCSVIFKDPQKFSK